MAIRLADAIAFLSADTKNLKSDLAGAEGQVQQSGGTMGGILTGIAQGIGQGVFGLVTGALSKVTGFIGDSITSASDLNEVANKVNVVFGDQAAAIQEWAADSATALGQSKASALGALGTFGNLFTAMGLSTDKSADMSKGLVTLASDLASFNNIDPTEALEKLRAGMTGEAEPLKALGVNMSAAAIEAKALQMGLADTTVDMTKVNAATLTLEKAQRAAAEALKKHGAGSIEYRQAAQGVAEADDKLKNALAGQTGELSAAAKAQAAYAIILEQTKTAQGDFANTSTGLANSQRIAAAQWENLKATLGTALLPVIGKLMEMLNQLLQVVLPPLSAFIQNTVTPAMTLLASTIGSFVTSAQGWFAQFKGSVDLNAIGPMTYLHQWFEQNMPRIQQIVSTVLNALSAFWETHGATIMRIVNNFLTVVSGFFDTAFKTILDLVTFFLQLLTGDFEGAGVTLAGIVERIWALIGTIFSRALDNLKALITGIDWPGLGFDIVQGMANGILGAVTVITTAAQKVAKDAFDAAKDFLGIHSPSRLTEDEIGAPFGEGIGVGARRALGRVAQNVSGGLQDLVANVQLPALPAAATATAGAMMNVGPITVNINGSATREDVAGGVSDGLLAALRAVGVR